MFLKLSLTSFLPGGLQENCRVWRLHTDHQTRRDAETWVIRHFGSDLRHLQPTNCQQLTGRGRGRSRFHVQTRLPRQVLSLNHGVGNTAILFNKGLYFFTGLRIYCQLTRDWCWDKRLIIEKVWCGNLCFEMLFIHFWNIFEFCTREMYLSWNVGRSRRHAFHAK